MKVPEKPKNEQARLHSLYELELLDKDTRDIFDGAVEMAAQLTGCPIALVTLIDSERQWFAAARNFEATETERDISFCGHAILDHSVMVIPDARVDARFHDNPLVTSAPNIVFYAGAPLATGDGATLGTVCVIDREPRYLSDRQVRALQQLSAFVSNQLELRRTRLRLERANRHAKATQHQQAEKLAALGRDLQAALKGVAQSVENCGQTPPKTAMDTALNAAREIEKMGVSVGQAVWESVQSPRMALTQVSPEHVMDYVLRSYAPMMKQRNIACRVQHQATPLRIKTDRERLIFLSFHLIGFLLSRSVSDAALSVAFLGEPSGDVTLSAQIAEIDRDGSLGEMDEDEDGDADLQMLDGLCHNLGAELTLLDDHSGHPVVRIALPATLSAA